MVSPLIIKLRCVLVLSAVLFAPVCGRVQAVTIETQGDAVVLHHRGQVIRIDHASTAPRMQMLIETDQGDVRVFGGDTPLVRGHHFDLKPQWAKIVRHEEPGAELMLGGTNEASGIKWNLRISVDESRLPIRFDLACDLTKPITLRGLEPAVLFETSEKPRQIVTVNQGPGNIYHGLADKQWGNSFPAAYLWMEGTETTFFVDGGSMKWTSDRSIFRFHNFRSQSVIADHAVQFGLNVVRRNFHELSPEPMNITFFLSLRRAEKPGNRLEALDRLIDTVSPLHPFESASPDGAAESMSWSELAAGVAADLSRRDLCWAMYAFPKDSPWRDGPAFSHRAVQSFPISPDYAVNSSCIDRLNRMRADAGWDFSTCNNYLSGWIAHLQSHPNKAQQSLVRGKLSILPAFYDPETGMICHATRHGGRVGPVGMSWQNLLFHIEMARVHRIMPDAEFDPAVGGRFLMSLCALTKLAHNENYNFPQWFDHAAKKAVGQKDEPEIGVIHEPWQAGSYSWIMCQAHRMTGDEQYLREAAAAVDALFAMRFTIENERYRVDYDDPADLPITEIFGNAWGMPACLYLFNETGDPRFKRRARDFRNSLLRMTYWYESELRGNARDQALHNLGLFRNHSGAFTGSPWESVEAALAMAEYLRLADKPDPLLLKVLNSYRQSAKSFFPIARNPPVTPCPKFADHEAKFLPVEDFYMLEHGGRHGGMGRCIYMSGAAFWNAQLFETHATPDSDRLMIVSLDALRNAASDQGRTFMILNPTKQAVHARINLHGLSGPSFRLNTYGLDEDLNVTRSAAALTKGIEMVLPPREPVRIDMKPVRDPADDPGAPTRSRDALARAYADLQIAAGKTDVSRLTPLITEFESTLADFRQDRRDASVESKCRAIRAKLAK